MAGEQGKFSIQDAVGGALRFSRENLALAGAIGAVGAAIMTALTMGSVTLQGEPGLTLLLSILSMLVASTIYAVLCGGALYGAASAYENLPAKALRLFGAMAVVGFFLFLVFMMLAIPGVLVIGFYAQPYVADLQAAQGDEAATMALAMRFVQEQPGVILVLMLVYGFVWLALTSRLYLAAPGTLANGRIITFETWKWTKNAMLRIIGARLMLLLPAYILLYALTAAASQALGFSLFDPAGMMGVATSQPAMFALYTFVQSFITIALYRALEAGLSAEIYRRLGPQANAADTF